MAKIIFSFSELITDCLHNKKEKFTNAVKLEIISKETLAELFQNLRFICEKELEKKIIAYRQGEIKEENINKSTQVEPEESQEAKLEQQIKEELEKIKKEEQEKKRKLNGN